MISMKLYVSSLPHLENGKGRKSPGTSLSVVIGPLEELGKQYKHIMHNVTICSCLGVGGGVPYMAVCFLSTGCAIGLVIDAL
jgi:hypothetical protein